MWFWKWIPRTTSKRALIHQFKWIVTWEVTDDYHLIAANLCVEMRKFLPQVLNVYRMLVWNYYALLVFYHSTSLFCELRWYSAAYQLSGWLVPPDGKSVCRNHRWKWWTWEFWNSSWNQWSTGNYLQCKYKLEFPGGRRKCNNHSPAY